MNPLPNIIMSGGASKTRETLLRCAHTAAETLRRDAEIAEQQSVLTSEAADALRQAGLFRLGVPGRFDGYEADLTTAFEVIAELAEACPSSAWIVAFSYMGQQAAGSYSEQALQDMWADGPDRGLCCSFRAETAIAETADDGMIVTGRWSRVTGCHHASWAWLSIPSVDGSRPGLALIPLVDLTIEKSWKMAGLGGTGSDTVVADKVFVPRHRMRSLTAILATERDPQAAALYRIPIGSVTLTMLAPMLGAAREVLRRTLASVESGKPLDMSVYARSADSPCVQAALADAVNLIDSAQLHLNRSATFLDHAAAAGTEPTFIERGRVRMDMAHASTCLHDAMQRLLTVGGASGLCCSNVIQRYWRDMETAARHPQLNTGLQREMYGRALVDNRIPISHML